MTLRSVGLALSLAVAAPLAAAAPMAGSVVGSKDYINRRGAQHEEEFIGEVYYQSAGTRLDADWALYRHANKSWEARGSVRLRRRLADGAEILARGERARHDEQRRQGELLGAPGGRVSFTHTPVGGEPDRGEGERLSWDGEDVATLSGRARVWGPRLELAADRVSYTRAAGRLNLEGGRPVLRQVTGEWITALKADEIVALRAPTRVSTRGRVRGWLMFRGQKKLRELAR